jgi:hypothetical protein
MLDRLIDTGAIICAAIVLLPIVTIVPALPLAVFSTVTGIALAPWIACAFAVPLALYVANHAIKGLV